MDYHTLLDVAVDLGWELAMSGAETFRVEESINRILASYGLHSESFVIPNNITVSIETPEGTPMTRMRRVGHHGNDLDAVEKFSALSRAICNRKPDPRELAAWLDKTRQARLYHPSYVITLGNFLGAFGFAFLFSGTLIDSLWAGLCGILCGSITKQLSDLNTNRFFSTIAASFFLALTAYAASGLGLTHNADIVIIGALMLLVPGLLFTNAMRDIIFGDTNSGTNRIVEVLLIAVAIALGTASAWNISTVFWGIPSGIGSVSYPFWILYLGAAIGCYGFSLLFNIHGPGILLCALGGVITYAAYDLTVRIGAGEFFPYFLAAVVASAYAEIMARVRKYPAISYLVVSIFPLIPGAGVYYTMNYAVLGEMELFAAKGMQTAAIAGVMAVGILLVSTTVRLYGNWKNRKK